MKILQVNCHYNYGSTGKIMYDISKYLNGIGVCSIMCYSRGAKVNVPGVYRIANEFISKIGKLFNIFYGRPLSWGTYATNNLIKVIEKEKPDIVHLHCINAYTMNVYKALEYLKKKQIATILTLHAEFMHTGGCPYAYECEQWKNEHGCKKCPPSRSTFIGAKKCQTNWIQMLDSFKGFNKNKLVIASVSPWLMNRARVSPILSSYHHDVVLNGIDTSVFRIYNCEEINRVKEKYGLNSSNIILHVTSDFNARIKGGKYLLDFDEELRKITEKDYHILVVGPSFGQKSTNRLRFIGVVKDQKELAVLYSLSDMTVLTSEKETFSMICAESLCCGTPIIGFKAGAPETISIPTYSNFCEFADTGSLARNAMDVWNKNYPKREISDAATAVYSLQKMGERYYALYNNLMKSNE